MVPAASGFTPLPQGFEPTSDDVLSAVSQAYEAAPPEGFDAIVFAGLGEPLLRLRALEDTARALVDKYPVPLRVNSNGLVAGSSAQDVATRLNGSGITSLSIALMTSDPEQESQPKCCR